MIPLAASCDITDTLLEGLGLALGRCSLTWRRGLLGRWPAPLVGQHLLEQEVLVGQVGDALLKLLHHHQLAEEALVGHQLGHGDGHNLDELGLVLGADPFSYQALDQRQEFVLGVHA